MLRYFREGFCFLSTAAAVRLMFSQIKSAVENYFPGETKAPQCFQLFSEISGYWREGEIICSLTGLANVRGF